MRKEPLLTVNLTAEEFAELSKTTRKSLSITETDFDSKLPFVERENRLVEMQREHWRRLHTTRMTPEQLKRWVSEIPGCSSCKQKFLKILLVIPPVFGDGWEHWTFTVHNVVNVDIGKQVFSWQAACKLYGWDSR